ncbi:MAG: flavin reductase [Solirubrobacterales bacterium]|nr:flavin reductase [Solirubrobacterales bacterium]
MRRSTDIGFAFLAKPAPRPDARSFRDALARFATGVAYVTAAPDDAPAGLVVNSLTSVSLTPPPVLFARLAARSHGHACDGRDASAGTRWGDSTSRSRLTPRLQAATDSQA